MGLLFGGVAYADKSTTFAFGYGLSMYSNDMFRGLTGVTGELKQTKFNSASVSVAGVGRWATWSILVAADIPGGFAVNDNLAAGAQWKHFGDYRMKYASGANLLGAFLHRYVALSIGPAIEGGLGNISLQSADGVNTAKSGALGSIFVGPQAMLYAYIGPVIANVQYALYPAGIAFGGNSGAGTFTTVPGFTDEKPKVSMATALDFSLSVGILNSLHHPRIKSGFGLSVHGSMTDATYSFGGSDHHVKETRVIFGLGINVNAFSAKEARGAE